MKNKEVEEERNKMNERLQNFIKEDHPEFEIAKNKIVAIGYLDISEPFEKGEVSTNFLNKLEILWNKGLTLGSLGHHECEFCIDEGNYKGRATSSSEKILIDKKNKIEYIFPEMIFHYIKEHKFKPSDEFIKLVMGI